VATTPAAPKPAPKPAPVVATGQYANPLAGASVTPERIDQGVDYGGSGTLGAIGDGTVTYAATGGTGWPGAFIEFRLTDGPDAGKYVYYAESVSPAAGLHVGQTVRAGQPIAQINGQIEIGWGSGIGTETLAAALGQWSSGSDASNFASPAGIDFSALIAQLGGPPGKVEG
jgi:murein DD-endopeptidase MepM/ murein hydrolase activator NlpD